MIFGGQEINLHFLMLLCSTNCGYDEEAVVFCYTKFDSFGDFSLNLKKNSIGQTGFAWSVPNYKFVKLNGNGSVTNHEALIDCGGAV
jgi:hypothetical protein